MANGSHAPINSDSLLAEEQHSEDLDMHSEAEEPSPSQPPGAPRKPARPARAAALLGNLKRGSSNLGAVVGNIENVESTVWAEKRSRKTVEESSDDTPPAAPHRGSAEHLVKKYAAEIDRLKRCREQDDTLIEHLKDVIKASDGSAAAADATRADLAKTRKSCETLAEMLCVVRAQRDILDDQKHKLHASLQALYEKKVARNCPLCQEPRANMELHTASNNEPHYICSDCLPNLLSRALASGKKIKCPFCREQIDDIRISISKTSELTYAAYLPDPDMCPYTLFRQVDPEERFRIWRNVLREAGFNTDKSQIKYATDYIYDQDVEAAVDRVANHPNMTPLELNSDGEEVIAPMEGAPGGHGRGIVVSSEDDEDDIDDTNAEILPRRRT